MNVGFDERHGSYSNAEGGRDSSPHRSEGHGVLVKIASLARRARKPRRLRVSRAEQVLDMSGEAVDLAAIVEAGIARCK